MKFHAPLSPWNYLELHTNDTGSVTVQVFDEKESLSAAVTLDKITLLRFANELLNLGTTEQSENTSIPNKSLDN
jgi:hypothetical protein